MAGTRHLGGLDTVVGPCCALVLPATVLQSCEKKKKRTPVRLPQYTVVVSIFFSIIPI